MFCRCRTLTLARGHTTNQVARVRQTTRLLAAALLVILASLISIRPVAASDPFNLRISNVRDVSFTVSWSTAANESGQVQLIDGAIYNDDRGANFSGRTHYITVTALQAHHAYSFDVVSGGIKYDNAGAHWTVITGAILAPRPPHLIVGQVKNPDGSDASEAIVFVTIQRHQVPSFSAPLSTLVTAGDGFFDINLGEARARSNPTSYFAYARGSDHYMNDSLTIQAIGARGTGSLMVAIADTRLLANAPMPMVVVRLSADMETPTIVVRRPTPTPAGETPVVVVEQPTLVPLPKTATVAVRQPTPAPNRVTPSADSSASVIGLVIVVIVVVGVVITTL